MLLHRRIDNSTGAPLVISEFHVHSGICDEVPTHKCQANRELYKFRVAQFRLQSAVQWMQLRWSCAQ